MAAKTVTGARAQVMIGNKIVGIFNNISFGLNYDLAPIYVLGRYTAAETVFTAQEVVSVSATGFRAVGAGPFEAVSLPYLKQLMSHEYIELAVFDRQTNRKIAQIHEVRPTGFSTSIGARGIEEISVSFTGISLEDESTDGQGSAGPDGELPNATPKF